MKFISAILLAAASSAQAQTLAPSSGTFSRGEIGAIAIQRKNVFDPAVPGEDWWVFRLANHIHIQTRESVILHEVLLPVGSLYDPLKAIETERNLRSLSFIRSAEVWPSSDTTRPVELLVKTQDSWTFKPQFSAGTEGGDNFLIYGLEENDLLGLGKTVSFFHGQIGGDVRNEFRYADPRVWGTWFNMTDLYATTAHGDEIGVLLDRPFFALDTPYAAKLSWARTIQEDQIFQDANETSAFIESLRTVQAGLDMRVNTDPEFVQRLHAGYAYQSSLFSSESATTGPLPNNRTLSGPMAGYSWLVPRYIKETDINSMKRVEDFNMGNEFGVQAGPSLAALGADSDRWILSTSDQQGLGLGAGRFALAQAGAQGRMSQGRLEDAIFYANVNLFLKAPWPFPQTFVSHLEFNTTKHLDQENQIIVGGDTGLRGYKNNSFTGNRSALLNVEDRFFYDRELLHLLYIGGVAFFDTGEASPEGQLLTQHQLKSDLGIGLRISPSRSTSGGVLRVDLAYALNSGPGPSRWVLAIRGGQAFSIFNSTNREALRPPDVALTSDSVATRIRRRD